MSTQSEMSRFEGSDGSVPVRHLKFSCKHTWKSAHPKIGEKNSCLLRVEGSGCLIGGRVPRTVPIVTRQSIMPSAPSGTRRLRPPGMRAQRRTLYPREPPAPAASTRPSRVRSPQRDSKSMRAGSLPSRRAGPPGRRDEHAGRGLYHTPCRAGQAGGPASHRRLPLREFSRAMAVRGPESAHMCWKSIWYYCNVSTC